MVHVLKESRQEDGLVGKEESLLPPVVLLNVGLLQKVTALQSRVPGGVGQFDLYLLPSALEDGRQTQVPIPVE